MGQFWDRVGYRFEHSVHPKQGVDCRLLRDPSQPPFDWLRRRQSIPAADVGSAAERTLLVENDKQRVETIIEMNH